MYVVLNRTIDEIKETNKLIHILTSISSTLPTLPQCTETNTGPYIVYSTLLYSKYTLCLYALNICFCIREVEKYVC